MRDSKQIPLSQREDGWCESSQSPVEPGSELTIAKKSEPFAKGQWLTRVVPPIIIVLIGPLILIGELRDLFYPLPG